MFTKMIKAYKTGLPLFAGALFLLCAVPATAGFAQTANDTSALVNRLNQLETDMQTLSRSVYRGEKPPVSTSSGDMGGSAISNFEVRLSQIEERQRALTGQIEQNTFQIQQLTDRLNKFQADMEMRLGGTDSVPKSYSADPARPSGADSVPRPSMVASGTLYAEPSGSISGGTLGTLSSDSGADPAQVLYDSAFNDIRDAKYESAESKFKKFMNEFPSHTLAANAQYWLAETFYVRGNYPQSAKMFAQGYQDYPKGAKASDSLLKLGLSLAKMDKKDDACLSFQQLKKDFPDESVPANRRAAQEMKQLGCK